VFLVLDIFFDGEFIDADGGNKVAPSPKIALGKSLGFLFEPVG